MSRTPKNLMLALLMAALLSCSYLLDGPSEIEAIQATADAKRDAIEIAAISAMETRARALNDAKTIVAAVQP